MLSDIENGKNVDYVLVYKLSRFGRNAADILNSLALLQTYDVNLICIEEGIDSSQTSGKLQGITKRPRKESDAKVFSGHFIQILLDNPVYCGKIAYGRRKHERVKGKKNEYRVVCQKEFSLTDGLHEGIVSEELWEKARNKRVATALKLASKIG